MPRRCSRSIPGRSTTRSIRRHLGINDFYLDDGRGGPPLGNIQLLGRVTAPILKSSIRMAPEWTLKLDEQALGRLVRDERGPPEPAKPSDGRRRANPPRLEAQQLVRARWVGQNLQGAIACCRAIRSCFRKPFDRRTPSHQCGTVRIGKNPSTSPLDPYCRAWDHPNLFVVDAAFLPTSAGVNPSLTIAAQALRVADHIATTDLQSG